MSTPQILQRLYSLENSSPDFSRSLYCLLKYDDEENYLTTLQGQELARLVDLLDKVHVLPFASVQLTKQTPL